MIYWMCNTFISYDKQLLCVLMINVVCCSLFVSNIIDLNVMWTETHNQKL